MLPCGRFILKRPVILRHRLPAPNTRFGFLTSPLPFWAVRGGGPRFPMPPVVSGRWCCLELSAVNARRWSKLRATLRRLPSPKSVQAGFRPGIGGKKASMPAAATAEKGVSPHAATSVARAGCPIVTVGHQVQDGLLHGPARHVAFCVIAALVTREVGSIGRPVAQLKVAAAFRTNRHDVIPPSKPCNGFFTFPLHWSAPLVKTRRVETIVPPWHLLHYYRQQDTGRICKGPQAKVVSGQPVGNSYQPNSQKT